MACSKDRKHIAALIIAGMGYKALSTAMGVNPTTAKEWILRYEIFGHDAFVSGAPRKASYSPEVRLAAASAVVDEGQLRADVCHRYLIWSEDSLRKWCAAYRRHGAAVFENTARAYKDELPERSQAVER